MAVLMFILGLSFLIAGAEALVRGASRLAGALGISPLVIGLTVVALGTSAPELAVSVKSVLSGQESVAVGNVIGSNIFNVLFILGLSALIVPMMARHQLVRMDVPLMIGLSVLVLLFSLDGTLSRAEGLILIAGLIIYLSFLIYQSRRDNIDRRDMHVKPGTAGYTLTVRLLNTGYVLAGLLLLILGSGWFVDSAVIFARHLGISELIVGLTIMAAGTSLPEVVTCVVAAVRGQRDIAVGNIVGSNILNIMAVFGVGSIVAPAGIGISAAVIGFDLPVMIAVAVVCLPIFFTGRVISRPEGALLLGYYAAYTLYLFLAASHHDALPAFSAVMLFIILPLTGIIFVIAAIRELRVRKRARRI